MTRQTKLRQDCESLEVDLTSLDPVAESVRIEELGVRLLAYFNECVKRGGRLTLYRNTAIAVDGFIDKVDRFILHYADEDVSTSESYQKLALFVNEVRAVVAPALAQHAAQSDH